MSDPESRSIPTSLLYRSGSGASRTVVDSPWAFEPPTKAGDLGMLGPYRILKELGRGGMGAVFLGVDTRLDRKVALKLMLPDLAASPAARERFLREARAAALLNHDHVVAIYEADEHAGIPFIAMPFLQGVPLDQYLKTKGTPAIGQAIRIALETARGLAAAHAKGLIHRDIKPANIWLEAPKGRVRILDFGLAKPQGQKLDTELTAVGAILGTPAYMPPEQARGEIVDARADLYSLGVILYQLVTGQTPFTGPNIWAVLSALAVDEPAPVREQNPAVPDELAGLIHELLAKKPENRPASAQEVVDRLLAIRQAMAAPQPMAVAAQSSFDAIPIDDPTVPLASRPVPKRAGLLWAGGALLIVALGVAALVVLRPPAPVEPAPVAKKPEPEKPDAPPKPTGPDARGRVPVPSRPIVEAQKKVLFSAAERRDWLQQPIEKRRELARQFLQRGPQTAGDAKAFAELELAQELAIELVDAPAAVAAIAALDGRYQIEDRRERKAAALEKIADLLPKDAIEAAAFLRVEIMALAVGCLAADDDAVFDRSLALAKRLVTKDDSDWFNFQIPQLEDRAQEMRTGRAWAKDALDRLQSNPDDMAAQGRAAAYTGLFRHEWTKAAKLADDVLVDFPGKAAFGLEKGARAKPSVESFRAAGDAWWSLAETNEAVLQVPMRRRARYWYLKTLFKTPLEARDALARDLVPRIDAVPSKPVAINIGLIRTVRTHRIFFTGDSFHTNYQTAGAAEVRVNHRSFPGKVPDIVNEGNGWLYPYDIDFSTVRNSRGSVFANEVLDWTHTPDGLEFGSYRNPFGSMTDELRMVFQADGYPNPNRFTEKWDIAYHALPAQKGDLSVPENWTALFDRVAEHTGEVPEFEFSSINADFVTLSKHWKWPETARRTDFGFVATLERDYPAGTYEVRMFQDDVARILVDDKPVLVGLKSGLHSRATFPLAAGRHRIRIEFIQYTGVTAFTHWLRRTGP